MVGRRLNKPVGRLLGKPCFWLYEVVGADWRCRMCNVAQERGSVTFEVFVPTGNVELTQNQGTPTGRVRTGTKAFLCLGCAGKFLDEVRDRVDTCQKLGKDGYKMMDEM